MEVLAGVTRFGRLTVVAEAPRIVSPSGFAALAAHVRCDCGVEKVVRAGDLKNGYSESCGCLQRELTAVKIADRSRTHGMAAQGITAGEYKIWGGMKQRCSNPKAASYPRYGGRGITVCARWSDSFEAFMEDMGPRPSDDHSIERENNDGNYEPSNCRWATRTEQARNRKGNTAVTIAGRTQTVIAWAEEAGSDPMTIYARLRKGWEPERAVYDRKMTPQERGVRSNQIRWGKAA
jgi:hypothetical protein